MTDEDTDSSYIGWDLDSPEGYLAPYVNADDFEATLGVLAAMAKLPSPPELVDQHLVDTPKEA